MAFVKIFKIKLRNIPIDVSAHLTCDENGYKIISFNGYCRGVYLCFRVGVNELCDEAASELIEGFPVECIKVEMIRCANENELFDKE